MKVAITGGQGFLGCALTRELVENRRWADPVMQMPGLPYRDLRREEQWAALLKFQPDVVFHLAAKHFIPECEADPDGTFETNVGITFDLISKLPNMTTLVFASSAAVYGLRPTAEPLKETDELSPDNVYARSKVQAEDCVWGTVQPGQRFVAARLFNLIGEGDSTPHLYPTLMKAKARGEAKLDVTTLLHQRDYVDVDEAALALADLAVLAPAGFTAVNVATGHGTSGWELASALGVQVVDSGERRTVPGGHLIGDPTLLRQLTSRAPHPLELP